MQFLNLPLTSKLYQTYISYCILQKLPGPIGGDPFCLLANCFLFLCRALFPTLLADFKDPIQNQIYIQLISSVFFQTKPKLCQNCIKNHPCDVKKIGIIHLFLMGFLSHFSSPLFYDVTWIIFNTIWDLSYFTLISKTNLFTKYI